MKLDPNGIERALVQQAHRENQKTEKNILGLAADFCRILEAKSDVIPGFGDADPWRFEM